jgi:hypothetical protein
MSLTNVARRLTASEIARESRSLAILAWFDGWGRAQNPAAPGMEYPRRLTAHEAESWREGWREGHADALCHRAHGFAEHTDACRGAA